MKGMQRLEINVNVFLNLKLFSYSHSKKQLNWDFTYNSFWLLQALLSTVLNYPV